MQTRTKCILKNLALPFITAAVMFVVAVWYIGILQSVYNVGKGFGKTPGFIRGDEL